MFRDSPGSPWHLTTMENVLPKWCWKIIKSSSQPSSLENYWKNVPNKHGVGSCVGRWLHYWKMIVSAIGRWVCLFSKWPCLGLLGAFRKGFYCWNLQKIHGAEEPCNFTGMMHDFNHLEFHSWLMDGYSPNMVIIGSEWFWQKKTIPLWEFTALHGLSLWNPIMIYHNSSLDPCVISFNPKIPSLVGRTGKDTYFHQSVRATTNFSLLRAPG